MVRRRCRHDQDTDRFDRIGRASEERSEVVRGHGGIDGVDADAELGAGLAEPSGDREGAVADEEQVLDLDAAFGESLQAAEDALQVSIELLRQRCTAELRGREAGRVNDRGGGAVVASEEVEPGRQRTMAEGTMVEAGAAQQFA
jgi:hypothetical protein